MNTLPNVTEHSCFLFYPVLDAEFPGNMSIDLAELMRRQTAATGKKNGGNRWVPMDALETITDKRSTMSVWEPGTLSPGNDLHSHVQRLLGGSLPGGAAWKPQQHTHVDKKKKREREEKNKADAEKARELHAAVYRLTEPVKKLLCGKRLAYTRDTPKEDRRPNQMTVRLSKKAKERIERHLPGFADKHIQIRIKNVRYVIFRSNYAFLVVEVCFGDSTPSGVAPYCIVEGLYSLSRFNRINWMTSAGKALEGSADFTFGTLVRSLIGGAGEAQGTSRVYTATCLRFTETVEQVALDHLLAQLARHYNDEYQVCENLPGMKQLRHFENITHAFSLEGCATAVDVSCYAKDQCPAFLETYISATYRKHYLPIMLLAYHEFCFLLYNTNDASFWPSMKKVEHAIERMKKIRRAISNFSLCFRFSYVSRLSMHNDVNQALRKALGLDWMLEELNQDTSQIDTFLQQVSNARREAQFSWAAILGTFGITWLTTFTIFKELLHVDTIHNFLHLSGDMVGMVAVLGGVTVGTCAAVITWMRGGHHHKESLAEHAVHENVIHQASHKPDHKA